MSVLASVNRKIIWGRDLPNQLIIKSGKLVLKTGDDPSFNLPAGTEVNLIVHSDAERLVDNSAILFFLGA